MSRKISVQPNFKDRVFKIGIFERRFESTLVTTLVVNYGSGNSSTRLYGIVHKVLTHVEYRAVSGVFQNIDPHPLSPE